jgi:hypothetical protein
VSAVRPVSGSGLLELWERCGAKPPVERALSLIAHGFPDMARAEIEALDIRARDRLLLELRAASIGEGIEGRLQCPHCGEWLEFELDADALRDKLAQDLLPRVHVSACGEYEIHLRPANSQDLALAARARDLAVGRRALLERLVEIRGGEGASVPVDALPAGLLTEALERLEALQSQCEMRLDFVCAACGAEHAHLFDAGAFFWQEISQSARRLIDEVHELAWAYGWPESEILAMSARRRQAYLDRIWQ